jgi:hypothetical protein
MLSVNSLSEQKSSGICSEVNGIRANSGARATILNTKAYPLHTKIKNVVTLKTFISKAKDGDVAVLTPGIYDVGHIQITKQIKIISQEPNAAIFPKNSWIEIKADNVLIQGLMFQDGASSATRNSRDVGIIVRGNGAKIIGNYFYNVGAFSTIADKTGITIKLVKANQVTISDNTFSLNRGIAIKTDDFSKNLLVEHNNFLDSPPYEGVGEVVQIGDALSTGQASSPHEDRTKARIRNNYIRGWELESELFSIKSDENTISENYIENSGNSAFVIRMGNRNIIENNVMVNNSKFPLRISGEENIIRNNFFTGTGSALFFHNEVLYRKSEKDLVNAYWAANRNLIDSNYFIGYEHLFGVIDQFHIVRDAPKENILSSNSFATMDQKALNRELKSAKHLSQSNNSVSSIPNLDCLN